MLFFFSFEKENNLVRTKDDLRMGNQLACLLLTAAVILRKSGSVGVPLYACARHLWNNQCCKPIRLEKLTVLKAKLVEFWIGNFSKRMREEGV